MPYMKLTTPEMTADDRARIGRELTEAVVQLLTPRNDRGVTPQ